MPLATKPESVEFSLMKNLVKSNKININFSSQTMDTQYEEIDYWSDSDYSSDNNEERKYWSLLHQLLADDINKVNSDVRDSNQVGSIIYKTFIIQSDMITSATELSKRLIGVPKGSVEYRNIVLDYRIQEAGGKGTREGVVAAATYLSEEEDIPYFWGGKYSEVGVNGDWNVMTPIPSEGSDIQFQGTNWPLGLDCSGFVTWAIINGGYKMDASYTGAYLDYANPKVYEYNVESLTTGEIKPGDLLYRKGHIAMITELDITKGTIKVAEEKGAKYGMVVTETTIEDFVNTNKYTDIYSMEEYYNNENNLLD